MAFEPISGIAAMLHRTFACVFALSLAAPANAVWAQSLADVSRAEEQRRKDIKAPSKVYTNKDLAAAPAPSTGTTADATAPAAEGDAAKEAAADDQEKPAVKDAAPASPADAKGQAYWAGRAKDLQTQLERDRSYAEALQSRINALTTDFANRSDPAQRAVVEQDRNRAVADLERLNQTIQNDQKAISDLDDEARRAGVPPGWLR
jgi:hypothetical protein